MTAAAEEFLDRVLAHEGDLSMDKFNYTSWKFENRPTSEGFGILPGQDIDVAAMADHILDVENYPKNVKYVEDTEIIERRSPVDVTYIQRMNLPVLGRIQVQIHLSDFGLREGWRIIAWDQDADGTAALNKKQGVRTAYNLGAWLLAEDTVGYALSSAPLKSDMNSLKYLAMTKGADATAGEVLRQNIEGMIAWTQRD
ncbi:MAG: hypothetical protein U0R64_09575 [Candidatus Nanopelagicales bacterium]